MKMSCRDVANACGGEIVRGVPEIFIEGFSIDTRTIGQGEWFVPLAGDSQDGHMYLEEALRKGASGYFCQHGREPQGSRGAVIMVADILNALHDTARFYRKRFAVPVIGITGSSGKTTTKDMVAAVLERKYTVLKTGGNYNNHIGLPLTVLGLKDKHQAVVLEMAMRGLGEIDLLAGIALPQWAMITNIGNAHIELLGSRDNIARAKGEILQTVGEQGTALLFGNDPYLKKMGQKFPGKTYYYGWDMDADFYVHDFVSSMEGCQFRVKYPGGEIAEIFLPYPGRHMALNGAAAAAMGYLLGVMPQEAAAGLREVKLTAGRLNIIKTEFGPKIIDDTYNANPHSMKAAFDVLKEIGASGRIIAVIGNMLELGDAAEESHRQAGRQAAEAGVNVLVTVGSWAKLTSDEAGLLGVKVMHCADNNEAIKSLQELSLTNTDLVLLKGSRGMRLEEVVAKLLKETEGGR